MGFSVRIAPGVRVRASSRGVRTSLGPRVARVHVGAGRTGFSTGVGPVGYYTSVGAPRRRSTGSVNRQVADTARQQAQADKAAEAQRLQAAFDAILDLHRESFPTAQRLVLPPPPEPPARGFRTLYRAQLRTGAGLFDRAARRAAAERADQLTARDVDWARGDLVRQTRELQARLDATWTDLLACEPGVVLAALNDAFEDNEAAASAVGVQGTEVTLLVVVPDAAQIPDRKPARTAAGNLSLKKLTKTELADFYKLVVLGHLLVTVREAFAVGPGIESARIVAVRAGARDAYGRRHPEVMAAGRCRRSSLAGVRWDQVHAVQVFDECFTDRLVVPKGATRALHPIPLAAEPDLAALVAAVDLDETDAR